MRRLPQYHYLYLGDTKRVPYGGRSQESIHEFTSQALNYLFALDCQLIILACNTASAEALRKSQQEYLPVYYPDRRVLGVIIPTAEVTFNCPATSKVGVLATQSTVESGAYQREILRQNPTAKVFQLGAPLLVPLIENSGVKYLGPILDDYLAPLIEANVDCVVLGCTHYCLVKNEVRARLEVPVISQDEVIPEKLENYLLRHPEIESTLDRNHGRDYFVTDVTDSYQTFANKLVGELVKLQKVVLN